MGKKKIYTRFIVFLIVASILVWLLTENTQKSIGDRAVQKITTTAALHFMGKRKLWTRSKTEQIFNLKGQIIEYLFFDKNICNEKITYSYNSFDSLKEEITYKGRNLIIDNVEIYMYDSLKRVQQKNTYSVNGRNLKKTLSEKINWLYDDQNNKIKKTSQSFYEFDPSHNSVCITIDSLDERGLLVTQRFQCKSNYNITNSLELYTYDSKGHIKTKFGGLLADSIYYKTNERGQVIEEQVKYGDFVRSVNKYFYDSRGNRVKVYLDIDEGNTFKFYYDVNNRITKESLSGSFLLFFWPYDTYEYEYF